MSSEQENPGRECRNRIILVRGILKNEENLRLSTFDRLRQGSHHERTRPPHQYSGIPSGWKLKVTGDLVAPPVCYFLTTVHEHRSGRSTGERSAPSRQSPVCFNEEPKLNMMIVIVMRT